MESLYKIEIYLDVEWFKWINHAQFVLNYDELLQLWREFRKWVLVHAGPFLINKRHIVSIRFTQPETIDIIWYMGDVASLESEPLLHYNLNNKDE